MTDETERRPDGPPGPGEVTVQWVTVAPDPARRRNRLLLIVAAAVIAALGVGAGVVWYVVGSGREAEAPPVTIPTSTTTTVTSASPAPSTEPTAAATPTIAPPTRRLPVSAPLAVDHFVVPRGKGDAGRLYLARVGGAQQMRRLPTPNGHRITGPTLSADRRSLVYVDRTADSVRVMAADGSGDRLLFDELPDNCGTIGHLSWDPADPTRMVLECVVSEGKARLMVIKDDGTLIRKLKPGRTRVQDPVVSPDGRRVAYWAAKRDGPAGGAIYALALDGKSRPKRLTAEVLGRDADPAWSPDGKSIAFRRRLGQSNYDVYVMRASGSAERRLLGGRRTEEKPAWSPDSKRVMIVSDRRAKRAGQSFDLYVVKADGRGLRAMKVTSEDVSTPVWRFR